ncbi:hypothetical protein [Algoriphagus boritolerans]|uniref:hypothetical protein n=1 Tax=Algoriphagus boritolerans TaxID=308111 RepID=UPI002FCE5636
MASANLAGSTLAKVSFILALEFLDITAAPSRVIMPLFVSVNWSLVSLKELILALYSATRASIADIFFFQFSFFLIGCR